MHHSSAHEEYLNVPLLHGTHTILSSFSETQTITKRNRRKRITKIAFVTRNANRKRIFYLAFPIGIFSFSCSWWNNSSFHSVGTSVVYKHFTWTVGFISLPIGVCFGVMKLCSTTTRHSMLIVWFMVNFC